jgi:hypothetical protein
MHSNKKSPGANQQSPGHAGSLAKNDLETNTRKTQRGKTNEGGITLKNRGWRISCDSSVSRG